MRVHFSKKRFFALFILLFAAYLSVANSTLSKNDRKGEGKRREEAPIRMESRIDDLASDQQEEEGEIVVESDLKEQILANHNKLDIGERKFTDGITLGYVTVWNNHGYDVAKWAATKFTHISPVWFQLKSAQIDDQLTCKIEGTHDIDMGWIEDILANNSDVQIVPRILFDGWSGDNLKQLLMEEQAQYRCVRAITDLLLRTQVHGAVMEIWLQIMAMTRGSAAEYLLEMVEFWAGEFHKAGLLFILPLTPPLNADMKEIGIVNREVINRLLASVDFVNLMTYDFSSSIISGVGPLYWVEANLRFFLNSAADNEEGASKILMGLNFYGYDRTRGASEAVLGKKYIELLARPDSALTFDSRAAEHKLTFGSNSVIYFPTTKSIQIRLDLARRLAIGGVAIWDLGQGLNHFTSVL